MNTMNTRYSEAENDRPRDPAEHPVTEAELIRFTSPGVNVKIRSQMAYRAKLAAKIASKPSFTLATEVVTVSFSVDADAGLVVITTNTTECGASFFPRRIVDIDAARAEYRRLEKAGYCRW